MELSETAILTTQKNNIKSVKLQLKQFMPQDFRGAILDKANEAKEAKYTRQVDALVRQGGSIRQKYDLLLQQQWERRQGLVQLGECSGAFKFLIRYLAGIPQELLDFTKEINAKVGPMEEQRIKYGPDLYVCTSLGSKLNVALVACLERLKEEHSDEKRREIVTFLKASLSKIEEAVQFYGTQVVRVVQFIGDVFQISPFFLTRTSDGDISAMDASPRAPSLTKTSLHLCKSIGYGKCSREPVAQLIQTSLCSITCESSQTLPYPAAQGIVSSAKKSVEGKKSTPLSLETLETGSVKSYHDNAGQMNDELAKTLKANVLDGVAVCNELCKAVPSTPLADSKGRTVAPSSESVSSRFPSTTDVYDHPSMSAPCPSRQSSLRVSRADAFYLRGGDDTVGAETSVKISEASQLRTVVQRVVTVRDIAVQTDLLGAVLEQEMRDARGTVSGTTAHSAFFGASPTKTSVSNQKSNAGCYRMSQGESSCISSFMPRFLYIAPGKGPVFPESPTTEQAGPLSTDASPVFKDHVSSIISIAGTVAKSETSAATRHDPEISSRAPYPRSGAITQASSPCVASPPKPAKRSSGAVASPSNAFPPESLTSMQLSGAEPQSLGEIQSLGTLPPPPVGESHTEECVSAAANRMTKKIMGAPMKPESRGPSVSKTAGSSKITRFGRHSKEFEEGFESAEEDQMWL